MRIIDGFRAQSIVSKEAVLIDVFRATTSIVVMFYKGVNEIIPAKDENEAWKIYSQKRDYILIGERDGIKIDGFHYNNSPDELMNADLNGRNVIFVSTNGTRVLKKIESPVVYIASFLNADLIANTVENDADLVCANRRDIFSIEDFFCASYIKARKMGIFIDFENLKEKIIKSKSAERLRRIGFEKDIHFALSLNSMPVLPVYRNGVIRKE